MIKILQEVTEWSTPIYNGQYHVNDSGQLVAYENSSGLTVFKTPKKLFRKTGRKFKQVGKYEE